MGRLLYIFSQICYEDVMKKKIVLALLMAALLAGGVFADGLLSAGGGLLFDLSGNNGFKNGDAYYGMRNTSFGGYAFFDATFVEVDVSFARGSLTAVEEAEGVSISENFGSTMQLNVSLLGKFPIFHLLNVSLFPLIGINYNMVFSLKDPGGTSYSDPGDMSQIGILGGIGADFGLGSSLYIRAEGMFQVRLPSKWQKDEANYADMATTFGLGPRVKAGIGIKL